VPLEAGTLQTWVRVDSAQTYQVVVNSAGASGVSNSVTIIPSDPFGTLVATADPDTITSNGVSTTTITSNEIKDQFGNRVAEGELITIWTDRGEILSMDQDAVEPGIQRRVQADGTVSLQLRSDGTFGTARVDMESVDGSPKAAGFVDVIFALPPIVVAAGDPIPNAVIIDQLAQFRVPVVNWSTTGVMLTTATKFRFEDGATYEANLESPTWLEGSSGSIVDTLAFDAQLVDPAITPQRYTPALELDGVDGNLADYSQTVLLPSNSLLVSAIEILSISGPAVLSRGDSAIVYVTVKNPTPAVATINTATLQFSPNLGGYTVYPSLDLPAPLAGGASIQARVPVKVSDTSGLGTDVVDARVTATIGILPVEDDSVDPHAPWTWTIQQEAQINYVTNTLSPSAVSIGKNYSISVDLENIGQAAVQFDTAATKLTFTDGTTSFETTPNELGIFGSERRTITFKPKTIPASMTPGNWPVTIDIHGTENGAPFNVILSPLANEIAVQDSAFIIAAGSLAPTTTVTQGADAFFELQVENTGDATVNLDVDATRIRFVGGNYVAALDPSSPTALGGGLVTTIVFRGEEVTDPPGVYPTTIDLVGLENDLQLKPIAIDRPRDGSDKQGRSRSGNV
jgi:hypothetical protein